MTYVLYSCLIVFYFLVFNENQVSVEIILQFADFFPRFKLLLLVFDHNLAEIT